MSIVRWLKGNTIKTLPWFGYYYDQKKKDNNRQAGSLYEFNWNTNLLIVAIKGRELTDQKVAIAARDPSTDKNAFHYLFSDYLFENFRADIYTVLTTDVRQNPPIIEQTRDGYYSPSSETLRRLHKNHAELFEKKIIKTTEERIKEFTLEVTEALLAPFDVDNTAFMNAFLAKDKKFNTPLYYAMNSIRVYPLEVLDRINKLLPDDKKRLLLEPNENGKNVLHARLWKWGKLEDKIKDVFGVPLLKKALYQRDDNNNTPLHDLLAKRSEPLKAIQSVCEFFKPQAEAKDEEPVLFEDLFCQNADKLNPMHLVCKLDPSLPDSNLKIFKELLQIMPENLRVPKMKELDNENCTPLHHAIKTGNLLIALEIFELLNLEERKELAKIRDSNGKTLLDYACSKGNFQILKWIVEALGPLELRRLGYEAPDLMNVVKANVNIQRFDAEKIMQLPPNKLMSCFDYFLEKYDPDNQDFKNMIDDFINCLVARKKGEKLPAENADFTKHDFKIIKIKKLNPRYQPLRNDLEKVSETEIKEFMDFIETASQDKYISKTTPNLVPVVQLLNDKMTAANLNKAEAAEYPPPPQYQPYEDKKSGCDKLIECYSYLEKSSREDKVNQAEFERHVNIFCAELEVIKNNRALVMPQGYSGLGFFGGINQNDFRSLRLALKDVTVGEVNQFEAIIQLTQTPFAGFFRKKIAENQAKPYLSTIPVAQPTARLTA